MRVEDDWDLFVYLKHAFHPKELCTPESRELDARNWHLVSVKPVNSQSGYTSDSGDAALQQDLKITPGQGSTPGSTGPVEHTTSHYEKQGHPIQHSALLL